MAHFKFGLAALVGVCLQLGLATSSAAVDGVNSVEQLLRKFSHTLQEKNYRGLFTYEYGGTLDTLEIIHVVQAGVEYERLQHLSGPSREVVRNGRPVNCVNTAAQLLRGGLFSQSKNTVQLHQYYNFSLGADERVADRLATVIHLMPKDQYRYGLTLSVDKETGFPMKILIIDENHKVLERIQFIALDFNYDADDLPLETADTGYVAASTEQDSCANSSSSSSSGGLVAQAAMTEVASTPSAQAAASVQWQSEWLPRGFVLSERSYSVADGHQLVYTDGLASFSVFIAPVASKGSAQPSLAQRGATVALMLTLPLEDYPVNVTVVGEVPAVTAEQVALGVRSPDRNGKAGESP